MKRIRDSQTVIGLLDGGEVAAALSKEITDTLADLKSQSDAVRGKKVKGEVWLKLPVEVEGNTATIRADIGSKRPKPVSGSSFFWVLDDGSLSTEHPEQTRMDFGGKRAAE